MRKPYFRKYTKSWYVTLDGKQVPLGKDKEKAFETYHELMANRGQAQASFVFVAVLFDKYLAWVLEHRSAATYKKARHYLNLFASFVGAKQRIGRLEPMQVTRWVESNKAWTATTRNDACSIVQRAFNWAVKRGHIVRSPVMVIEDKPRRKRRETVYSLEEWQELRSLVLDQEFGDLLDFMWLTGCRPIEARMICKRHVDLTHAMVVFPPSEAKGEEHERVIFLSDAALSICKRLVLKNPTGPVFLNTKGRPWTSDAINCRFQRLKKKLGRRVFAYAIRHSYATEGLKMGMDSLTLAQLMGHSDTSMLTKVYAHLARNPAYLREQAKSMRA